MISISLVTPSFNKAPYLEASLRSVLDQAYTNLEYGVIDAGSTDGSVEILERYKSQLSYLVIEPDQGMYDAVGKGFARSQGEVMGYLGADDLHMPWTLSVVGEIFEGCPEVQWITTAFPITADDKGRIASARFFPAPTAQSFWQGRYLPGFSWFAAGWLQQESTFWRRSLWERAGGLDTSLKLAGDFDLWCRFMKLSPPETIATPLAAFRRHGNQISSNQDQAYKAEALEAFKRHGGRPAGYFASRLYEIAHRLRLVKYGSTMSYHFQKGVWRSSV
ncbi:MAG: glycosyltransferase [Alphaproteobacteria bacterium]|nr:glycosyltransferase [Alphaproteobacteria bacterium]